jgi:hypothetical protein
LAARFAAIASIPARFGRASFRLVAIASSLPRVALRRRMARQTRPDAVAWLSARRRAYRRVREPLVRSVARRNNPGPLGCGPVSPNAPLTNPETLRQMARIVATMNRDCQSHDRRFGS